MKNEPKIAIVGSGSWAIALLKILTLKKFQVFWWIRTFEELNFIENNKHSSKHLINEKLNLENVTLSNSIHEVILNCDIIVLVTPSAYLNIPLEKVKPNKLKNKLLVSAIKGFAPNTSQLISNWLFETKEIPNENFICLSGPSHAEEVVLGKYTFLTSASKSIENAKLIANLFSNDFLKINSSLDVEGLELAGLMKNIYAIGLGILNGMDLGDNFKAVLVSAALREMELFFNSAFPLIPRNLTDSGYMGDLIVTAYSSHSRNRQFGNFIGQGLNIEQIKNQMQLPEGYFSLLNIQNLIHFYSIKLPIIDFVNKSVFVKSNLKENIKDLFLVL